MRHMPSINLRLRTYRPAIRGGVGARARQGMRFRCWRCGSACIQPQPNSEHRLSPCRRVDIRDFAAGSDPTDQRLEPHCRSRQARHGPMHVLPAFSPSPTSRSSTSTSASASSTIVVSMHSVVRQSFVGSLLWTNLEAHGGNDGSHRIPSGAPAISIP
jgi:hypothetical protein